eukprot:m.7192 g.7192  ORF g.7192 m.7192 type:complete len:384 (-) comp3663_c0_seq1:39-1190(-)
MLLCKFLLWLVLIQCIVQCSSRDNNINSNDVSVCPHNSKLVKSNGDSHLCMCSANETLCVGPKCKSVKRRNTENIHPREPTNTHEKKQYWAALQSKDWTHRITSATPSLWPSREKAEGFPAKCGSCECVKSCPRIVFVVGCGHSGTTYMVRLLSSHPKYHGILQETGWFTALKSSAAAFERYRQEAVACGRAHKQVVVEKTAKHVARMANILHYFADVVKIVVMVRDGRDVAYSVAKRFGRTGTKFNPCVEAFRWVLDNRAVKPYLSDSRVYIQRYEDLIENPENAVHKLFQFLENEDAPAEVLAQFSQASDLPWGKVKPQKGEIPPDHDHNGLVNKKYRNWQVNRPLFDGRNQWKTGLTPSQAQALFECQGFKEIMKQHGYI